MGVGLGTALLIGAGLGTAGAVAGSAISSTGAQQANENAMAFNAEQAALNRNYQTMMYERQKLDQENFYKQYQSPQAIGKALSGLGVNPASIFSGQSLGGSVPSMPSVPSGSQAAIGSLMNPLEPYAQGLQGVTGQAAQMLSVMSDSKLKDAQTLHVLKQAYGQEFTNKMLEISAAVAEWKIPEHAKAEINDLMASAALKNANGKLSEAQTDVEKILKLVRENDVTIGSQQILDMSIRLAHLETLLTNQVNLVEEQVKTERAKQSETYQNVRESKSRTTGFDIENGIKAIEFDTISSDDAKAAKLDAYVKELLEKAQMSEAKRQEFITLENRYKRLNKNDKNAVSGYINYTLWFIKENLKGLGFLLPLKK